MNALTDLEYRILDEAYFVVSYSALSELAGLSSDAFNRVLLQLLNKKLIIQLRFEAALSDYRKLDSPEPGELAQSSFVVSRAGLLMHNSRD